MISCKASFKTAFKTPSTFLPGLLILAGCGGAADTDKVAIAPADFSYKFIITDQKKPAVPKDAVLQTWVSPMQSIQNKLMPTNT